MTRDTARAAYDDAGFGPDDVDLALCHDAFANEELEYYELLGFCPEGEGERLVDEGATALGGSIPFNTDGGLIARGHPGGPTGLAMVHEIVQQLRRRGGGTPGRRREDRAGAPGRRRQRVHGEPVPGRLAGLSPTDGPMRGETTMDDELLERGREIQARLWPQMRAGGGGFPAARLAPDFFR